MRRASLFLAAAVLLPFANGVDSMVLAAFLAPLVLLRMSRASRPVPGLLAVFALEALAFAVQFRGMIPVPGSMLAFIVMFYAIGLTIPYLADRWLARRLSGWSATLVFPCAWAVTEYAISFSPYGSWGSAAYALNGNLALLQLLSITGLWGVTFLIGWVASAGNHAWELAGEPRRALRAAGAIGGVAAVVVLGGSTRLALFPPDAPTVRVASLSRMELTLHADPKVLSRFYGQKALLADELAEIREHAATIDDDLLARSAREAANGARIVFWGEANAPVLAEDAADLVRRGAALAKGSGIYLGMALAEWHRESSPPLENKIVLIGPDGTVIWEYLKTHPVPGGEAAMSVVRGGKLLGVDTPYGRLTSAICFDADFPQLLAEAGALRADLVLDPSNDWLAVDPWHTTMASYRAIEQGVNLVRHASLGRSAAYDYQGRLLASMDHFRSTDHALISHVPTRGVRTVYAMMGDWFAWASLLGLTTLAVLAITGRRKDLAYKPPSSSTGGTPIP
jgi:apolipoprotein N-acyltransferase